MSRLLQGLRRRIRRVAQRAGWDIVRYRPPTTREAARWPMLLGAARLPIRTVLEVGAKDGDTARIFRGYFPEATIHCFEPHPLSFQALTTWAATQGDHVRCYPFALGDHEGQGELFAHADRLAVASLLPTAPWRTNDAAVADAPVATPVAIRRLDDVVASIALEDDILLKIDTEFAIVGPTDPLIRRSTATCGHLEHSIWRAAR